MYIFLIIRVKSPKHKSFLVVVFFVASEGLYSFVQRKNNKKLIYFSIRQPSVNFVFLLVAFVKYTTWCSRIASNFQKDNYSIEIARLDLSSVDSGVQDFSPSRQLGTYNLRAVNTKKSLSFCSWDFL